MAEREGERIRKENNQREREVFSFYAEHELRGRNDERVEMAESREVVERADGFM